MTTLCDTLHTKRPDEQVILARLILMPDVQPLEPTDPLRLGPYRVTGRIGSGGQGVVYLGAAEDGSAVAIKLFHVALGADRTWRDAFARELEVAKRVARFCVAQVLDSGTAGGRPYIVSEYVPGPSLQHVVSTEGPRSGSALDRLAISTSTALVALHDAGVVHRDFKPQNVLLAPDGPRVIDFGIARALAGAHTVASQVVGTPAYMAPEQFAGDELGLAVDVFSWAATMAFAATGRPPFGADTLPAIMNRVLTAPPDLDGVEPPLRDLLAECLAKDPAERPSAHRILDRLVRRNGYAVSLRGAAAGDGRPAAPAVAPEGPADEATPPPGAGRGPASKDGARATRRLLPVAALAAAVAAGAAIVVTNAAAFGLRPGVREATATPLPRYGSAAPSVTEAPPTGSGGRQAGRRPGPAATPGVPARAESAPTTGTVPPGPARPGTGPTGHPGERPTAAPETTSPPEPTTGPTQPPAEASPTAGPATPPPAPRPTRPVRLGPARFGGYCRSLGWEWVRYRGSPRPGPYCVRGDDAMYLDHAQRDAGCRWRYGEAKAFHRYRGRGGYCYVHR